MAEKEEDKIRSLDVLPVDDRTRTDCCCTIFNTAFVVLLFVILLFTLNTDTLSKIAYPNDGDGRLCGYEVEKYPYLYFTSLTDTSKRLCVSKCPSASDTFLLCSPTKSLSCKKNDNPAHEVIIYDSYLDKSRIGLICMPKDEAQRESLLEKSETKSKYEFLGFYDAIWRSVWISIIFAICYYLFVYFQPYIAVPWTILIGALSSAAFGVLILFFADGYFVVKLLLSLFFLALSAYSFSTIIKTQWRESIHICSRFIHSAAIIEYQKEYTGLPKFNKEGFSNLGRPSLLVLAFMALSFAFFWLIILQILSAYSCAKLVFLEHYPFYDVTSFGSIFLLILILIQAIWGFSFLKEAFNFIASGYSAHKYYSINTRGEDAPLKQREPGYLVIVKLLLKYHWGSVVGGSILVGFFFFADLLFDFVYPQGQKKYKESQRDQRKPIGQKREFEQENGCSGQCLAGFFDLIREDANAYTFLTGLPYCQSARYCQYLADDSKFYHYSQTVNRLYRLNAHIIPVFFTVFIAMMSMRSTGNTSPFGLICITIITFFIVTFPIAYLADTAEGLLISTYIQQSFNDQEDIKIAPAVIRRTYLEDLNDTYVRESKDWYRILIGPFKTE